MYRQFFGLKDNPFKLTPDPHYLLQTPATQEALACLKYGVQARKGFVVLTGDVGTGKTTLLNKLLEWLAQEQVASAFVFNPRLDALQFLEYITTDFGIDCNSHLKSSLLTHLNNWLMYRYRAGTTAVLIVDEAQDLSAEVLEEIRLLTNLETPTEKLLQVVLSGQQELELRLRQPEFRHFRQRIALRCKTQYLTLEETHRYIVNRLRVAGSDGRTIFTPGAVHGINFYSQGIPRVINSLCDDALIIAFAEGKPWVQRRTIEVVARELELDKCPPRGPIVPASISNGGPTRETCAATAASTVAQPEKSATKDAVAPDADTKTLTFPPGIEAALGLTATQILVEEAIAASAASVKPRAVPTGELQPSRQNRDAPPLMQLDEAHPHVRTSRQEKSDAPSSSATGGTSLRVIAGQPPNHDSAHLPLIISLILLCIVLGAWLLVEVASLTHFNFRVRKSGQHAIPSSQPSAAPSPNFGNAQEVGNAPPTTPDPSLASVSERESVAGQRFSFSPAAAVPFPPSGHSPKAIPLSSKKQQEGTINPHLAAH